MEGRPRPSSDPRPSGAREWVHTCERCGERMHEAHCKIVCPSCGYVRDCSDP